MFCNVRNGLFFSLTYSVRIGFVEELGVLLSEDVHTDVELVCVDGRDVTEHDTDTIMIVLILPYLIYSWLNSGYYCEIIINLLSKYLVHFRLFR